MSLARTLLTRPKVLLADEVDAGLDDDNAEKVARILAKAAADGMAIVRIRTGRRMAAPHVSYVLPMARSRSPATPKRTVLRRVVLRRVTR